MSLDREEFLTLKEKHRNGYPNHDTPPEEISAKKIAERESLERDVEEFLSKGGQITEVGATKPYEHPATYSISRKRWAD